jgi:hypothetical protein
MRYTELNENYSPEEDKSNQREVSDTRKERLTLVHLSKLRKIREYRKYQNGVRSAQVKRQYSAGGDEAAGGDLGAEL